LLCGDDDAAQPAKRTAYSGAGSDRVFSPVERELVFDIVSSSAPPSLN
jgi:hypothetical protein